MDMERKKNKTDKERLVASTAVQDVPAFGAGRKASTPSHSICCREGLRILGALPTPATQGAVLRPVGPCPATMRMASKGAQCCRSRGGAEVK